MKATKEEWIEEQRKKIEKEMKAGNSKQADNTFKAPNRTKQHKSVVQDSSENILTESAAVLKRWNEYCSALYNCALHADTSPL